ncbi:hypothetical protein [Ramlibacter tataouinensis]|nr:hypothetical protein [Ramlibacter tataouinensis]
MRARTSLLATGALLSGAAFAADAPATATFDLAGGNLMAVLRPSAGENKTDEDLRPYGKVSLVLEDGREVEVETSWYRYLGDMHIRLVFDGPQKMQSASPEDLARLRLDPQGAVQLAVANLRRVYGEPQARPWTGGLMQVQGRASDLSSSYFLDREFWLAQQALHPQGLVAAVPRHGGLVYAPADDAQAVERLRFSAVALYAGSPRGRVSSALYLFKDGRWSVFQPPLAH